MRKRSDFQKNLAGLRRYSAVGAGWRTRGHLTSSETSAALCDMAPQLKTLTALGSSTTFATGLALASALFVVEQYLLAVIVYGLYAAKEVGTIFAKALTK